MQSNSARNISDIRISKTECTISRKNYLLQNSDGNVDLYDATDKMEQEYREFRKNPLVAEYLAAENAFCRVVQKVNWTLIEELDFEVGFEE